MCPLPHLILLCLVAAASSTSTPESALETILPSTTTESTTTVEPPQNVSRRTISTIPTAALSGYRLRINFSSRIPFPDAKVNLNLAMGFNYFVDTGTVTGRVSNTPTRIMDRLRMFSAIEKYANNLLSGVRSAQDGNQLETFFKDDSNNPLAGKDGFNGLSGRACLLRAVCEVAHTPLFEGGLIQEALNLLLIPWPDLAEYSSLLANSDLAHAQTAGAFAQDCSDYEMECPISLFEMFQSEAASSSVAANATTDQEDFSFFDDNIQLLGKEEVDAISMD